MSLRHQLNSINNFDRLWTSLRKINVINFLCTTIIVMAAISSLYSYILLEHTPYNLLSPETFSNIFISNIIFVSLLIIILAIKTIRIWRNKRISTRHTSLQKRSLNFLLLLSILPTMFIATFAVLTINNGLNELFDQHVSQIILDTKEISKISTQYQESIIRKDLISIEKEIVKSFPALLPNQKNINLFLTQKSKEYNALFLVLLDSNGKIIQQADTKLKTPNQHFFQKLIARELKQTDISTFHLNNQIQGIIKLKNNNNRWLYISSPIPTSILPYINQQEAYNSNYYRFKLHSFKIQMQFGLFYLSICIIVLVFTVFFTLWFSNKFFSSVQKIITAAKRMSKGLLETKVIINKKEMHNDLRLLGVAFNTMGKKLLQQRNELIATHQETRKQHLFNQRILDNIYSGVISIDKNRLITQVNKTTTMLMGEPQHNIIGEKFSTHYPILNSLLDNININGTYDTEIEIQNDKKQKHTISLHIRPGFELSGNKDGYIITFEDVTDLIIAQRATVWKDVAQRIAHEIKNPLTPIQLSVDRIKSKYKKEIKTDIKTFDKCTNTIIRQVENIRHMVDEFSSFARMPKAIFKKVSLEDIISQSIFLQRIANKNIEYLFNTDQQGSKKLYTYADERLLGQAITNILKNAAESIQSLENKLQENKIIISLIYKPNETIITITDTGVGWKISNKGLFIEPYMTTRTQGTGLGLAIVKKIINEHAGKIILDDAPWKEKGKSGSQVTLILPKYQEETTVGALTTVKEVK